MKPSSSILSCAVQLALHLLPYCGRLTLNLLCEIIIIIKCMWSRCRRDDIHVCFAYASPQRMPHM